MIMVKKDLLDVGQLSSLAHLISTTLAGAVTITATLQQIRSYVRNILLALDQEPTLPTFSKDCRIWCLLLPKT